MANQNTFLPSQQITQAFTTYKPIQSAPRTIFSGLEDIDVGQYDMYVNDNNRVVVNPKSENAYLDWSIPYESGISATPITPVSNTIDDKAKWALEYITSRGYSLPVAAGIVGNLMQESNLNTGAIGDQGTALGLAQWRLDRRKKLENYAKSKNKDVKDFYTQLEFLVNELESDYTSTSEKLKKTNDTTTATRIFMEEYERPSKKYAEFERRKNFANKLLNYG